MATFSIVNNIGALNALNRLEKTGLGLSRTIERLSSGLRINSAADDASGLAIADGLRADVAALNQAVRNANDGISVVEVADGALAEISQLLQRSVSLAEQAASDTSGEDSGSEKQAINDEYQEILREINRLSLTVDFNGRTLFGTTGSTFEIHGGGDDLNYRFLTDGNDLVLTPRFSPTTQEITYLSYIGDVPRVYLFNLNTGQQEVLGDFPGMTFAPRFSPDGNKVIMSLADDGNSISRKVNCKHFVDAMELLNRIADVAESEQHHPDLHLTGYRKVRVELMTHAIGGLSENSAIRC